jgi:protein-disulfide isomerase
MRFLLVLLPALVLTAQAQTGASVKKVSDTKTAAAPVSKEGVASYKVSGSPSAPMTIELYTDIECPACRHFFLDVLPELTKDFIATGKVRLIHRDFRIVSAHPYTKVATRYLNAAGEIGKYDIVLQQMFQTQPEWAQNGNVDAAVAKVLTPAEMEKVRALVKNDTHLDDSVVRDEAMANSLDHLGETPYMAIVVNGKREAFPPGQMSYSILKQYLNQKLGQ